MFIEFSKVWGQDENRWNYCGGDWNYRTMTGFMSFYGIKEAWVTGTGSYYEGEKEIFCNEYTGWATKELDRLKKHWHIEYCNPSILITLVPKPHQIKLQYLIPS